MDRSAWVAITIGSTVGSFVPILWGGGLFGSLIWGSIGALAAVWLNFRMTH